MSDVNQRILENIDSSDFREEIKKLLRALLTIERRNFADKTARYTEDYDRIIKELAKSRGYREDE
jgi:hypothetical protein